MGFEDVLAESTAGMPPWRTERGDETLGSSSPEFRIESQVGISYGYFEIRHPQLDLVSRQDFVRLYMPGLDYSAGSLAVSMQM